MATGPFARIVLLLLCVMVLPTTVQSRAFLSAPMESVSENSNLRISAHKRPRRESVGLDTEQCALLTNPWIETTGPVNSQEPFYRIRVHPRSEENAPRTIFPEQSLFRFIKRIYQCCQMGYHCGSVKGIQGRLHGTALEFILSHDVLSVSLIGAEMHLHVSNPQHLQVDPVILYLDKRSLPTRYNSRASDEAVVEMKLDLLFFFQALQKAMGGTQGGPGPGLRLINMRQVGGLARLEATSEPWARAQTLQDAEGMTWGAGENGGRDSGGGPLQEVVELGFALRCRRGEETVSCRANGVRLQHAPFITLSYR